MTQAFELARDEASKMAALGMVDALPLAQRDGVLLAANAGLGADQAAYRFVGAEVAGPDDEVH